MKFKLFDRKKAFSLAEVLVVVGIIGVVASLTLPNLNKSTNDQEFVTRYMKVYAELSTAVGSAVAKYGPISSWLVGASTDAEKSKIVATRITQYMKISKSCGTGSGCGSSGYVKYLNGNTSSGGFDSSNNANDYKYILANGVSLNIQGYDTVGAEIDLDGKNQNVYTWGKDFFGFDFDNNTGEVKPYGWERTEADMLSDCLQTGFSCGNWIIRNGNMDYLKCPSKLSWTNTTCK